MLNDPVINEENPCKSWLHRRPRMNDVDEILYDLVEDSFENNSLFSSIIFIKSKV